MGQCKYLPSPASWAGLVLLWVCGPASADDGGIGLVLERSLAAPDIFQKVEGAKSTILVPGCRTSAGVDTFTREEWAAGKHEWPEVMAGAMAIADRMVDSLEVDWERDGNGVILYGVVRNGDPFFGSTMFSKRFLGRFRAELGAELFVVVPEQGLMFVFPRYGGRLEDFAEALTGIYTESALRVSLEVFLVNETGCRAVGAINGAPRD